MLNQLTGEDGIIASLQSLIDTQQATIELAVSLVPPKTAEGVDLSATLLESIGLSSEILNETATSIGEQLSEYISKGIVDGLTDDEKYMVAELSGWLNRIETAVANGKISGEFVAGMNILLSDLTKESFTGVLTSYQSIPDISVYQEAIDMDKFCAGNDFAILRARVNGKDDTKFAGWAVELKKRGFPFAVYDYLKLKSEADAVEQADAMYAACAPYNPKVYYLDTEELADGMTYEVERELIKVYVKRLREHGVKVIGQYTGDYRWRTSYREIESIFDTLWIASWGANEGTYTGWEIKSAALTDKIYLHQYTSNGYSKVAGAPGIDHRIDLNRLTGAVPLSWFTGRKYAENAVEPTYASYVVQSGDSLWKIAKNLLGDGRRWTEIAALNEIENTIIHTGEVLKIPE